VAIAFVRERYRHGSGVLHQADPRVKLLTAVLFAFAVTLVPAGHWLAYGGFALFVAATILASGLPPTLVFGRSMLALPFVAVAVPLLFTREGHTIFDVPLLGWSASREGAIALASIMLKSWLAVLMAVVLTAVTRPLDLIRALERLRVPRILVATVLFMYRYIFVIGEEGQRLMRARDCRSADSGQGHSGGTVWWRGRVLGNLVGSLFLHSYERSERIYAAMRARGYDGTIRFVEEQALATRDWALLSLALILLAGLATYARL
jgi:cobalt/nickel transport system permease protein